MRFSYNQINEFVPLSENKITPNDVSDKLTFAGIEVEDFAPIAIGTNLVVGKVIECEDIVDTHLHLCKVDLGKELGINQIVCGAPNCRKDLKVIVALPGAHLFKGDISVSTIRGYESKGMLCSLLELGVNERLVSEIDLHGIHELDDSFEIGDKNILNKLGLDDTIFNIKLLANRSDLLSIYNIAKELANLFNLPLKELNYKCDVSLAKTDFKINSETPSCPLFNARIIKGIQVKESSDKIKKFLIASGLRPINNIVDISNYVMLLTGQPLHFYDYDKLAKKELIVKSDITKDFVALDGNTYKVINGDVCITSNDEIMCLGGVMGGQSSMDDINTKNIVIEAAYFNSKKVRQTSTRLNLISDSSYRFSHGINPHQSIDVINLTTALIKETIGFDEASEIISYDKINHDDKVLKATYKEINDILATNYSKDVILNILKKDYFNITNFDEKEFTCIVPKYRIDIDGVNDLAEEVIRLIGFKDVKNELPKLNTVVGSFTRNQTLVRDIKNYLRNNSLYEVCSYVLVNKKESTLFNYLNNGNPYKVINPMTDEHEYVRTSLTPSLLKILSYNVNHQSKDFGIFEIADVNYDNKKETYLNVLLTGRKKISDLNKVNYSFYDLKGILENVFSLVGIDKTRYQLRNWDKDDELMHITRSANVFIGNKLVAYLGELHPNAYKEFDIKNEKVYCLEINLNAIFDVPVGQIKYKAIPRFPIVTRDLALVCNKSVEADKIISIVRKNSSNIIKDVRVFDVYEDAKLGDNKSVAISLTLYNLESTLKDDEVNLAIEKVKAALLKENITIR